MYLSFYGFKEEPFRLTPDPRFLHLAEPHRAALSRLVGGVLLRKGIMVVTGPVGTGKTTLLHTTLHILAAQSAHKGQIATAFLLNPTLSREELLEAILEEFEVSCPPAASKPRRLTALHQMLLDMQRRGGTAVLIVDDAQLLTLELLEEIRLLNNTDSYHEKLLQIILSGQPELLTTLARPELRALQQRIAGRCHLRALSGAETRAYIAERMHAAGLRGPSPFPGPALEQVHHWSNGVPRLINLICDGCLTIGSTTQRKQIGPDIVEEAAAELGYADPLSAEPARSPLADFPGTAKPPKSPVDLRIETMRQGRTTARE